MVVVDKSSKCFFNGGGQFVIDNVKMGGDEVAIVKTCEKTK